MKIKAIDLFSGCGGVSCGLTNAGFKVTGAVEIDKNVVNMYKRYSKLRDVNVILDDITNVNGFELLSKSNINKDEIYLLAGCPPCQNFSSQNKQNRLKTREEKEILLLQYLRIIKEIYPPFILMENVPGIQSPSNKEILNTFLYSLENQDELQNNKKYFVEFAILNAADFGVPQKRRRFVMHAIRMDIYESLQQHNFKSSLPKKTHNEHGTNGLNKWISVWETISDLPEIRSGERYNTDKVKNHTCANLSELNQKRMRIIRQFGGNRNMLPEELQLRCHKNYVGHSDVYGIMNPDMPAPTITGGCLSYSKGRFGHPYQNRAISIREAARLQTFPDDFEFDDSITKSALAIGNAVPIKLVEASANNILNVIYKFLLCSKTFSN